METKNYMKSLGFTEYETKAYLALLREHPLTGYAVAKNSGVPRSKIYEVLEGLVARGDVIVSPGSTPLYRPLAVSDMVAKRRAAAEESFSEAEKALSLMEQSSEQSGDIWNVRGRDAILRHAVSTIEAASKCILLEVWAEDFPELEESLKQAHARGVQILVISYGEIQADYAEVYPHDASDEITAEYGARWIILSADDKQVVTGTVSLGEDDLAAWTAHPGLTMPVSEVIIHDLYIAEIMKTHREVLEAAYGKNLSHLRRKFAPAANWRKEEKQG